MKKILIIDDEQSVRYSLKKILSSIGYEVIEADSAEQGIESFTKNKPDLVILDIEMPGKDGLEALQEIKKNSPDARVLIITAYGTGDRVIKAMKFGAFEYIEKPFDIPHFRKIVDEALQLSANSEPPQKVSGKTPENDFTLVGESPAIKEVFKLIGRVAASDASILIVGESGTGKEMVARAIHRYSDRASKPFIAVNCAAIPDTLLESELFGYEKGAFTGADKSKPGKFEAASDGTLFLDEIGDMSLSLQAKLLRVLQEGTIERLGSSYSIKVNVRIVAATNRNLESDIIAKRFREDLYYRLKVITISLPPLRVRMDDLPLLVNHFLQKHSKLNKNRVTAISSKALEKLLNYPWPGNIRELENVIKRAIILAKTNTINENDILDEPEPQKPENISTNNRLFAYLNSGILQHQGEIFNLAVAEFEKDLIKWAMEKCKGNQVKASKMLGISRAMLRERVERYDLRTFDE